MTYEERQLLLKLAEFARHELRRDPPSNMLGEEIGNLAFPIATKYYMTEWGYAETYDYDPE